MALAAACFTLAGCTIEAEAAPTRVHPLDPAGEELTTQLASLREAIGDSRIVLLGENGHGVGDLTQLKARLVPWLHRELGFEVLAFESGFFECGQTWRARPALPPRDMLFDCLRYPFQHAEALPLFEYVARSRSSATPLELAGVDLQAQGYDSEARPQVLFEALSTEDRALASRVARLDSALYLVPDQGGLGDGLDAWILEHADSARAAYEEAAAQTSGFERWAFLLASGWVDRLLLGAQAGRAAEERPPRYYELRDLWMARAVAAHADSLRGARKVVVWLHNDHARYGNLDSPAGPIRSTGDYLREWYGDAVFSIGLFMGRGSIADNRRQVRPVGEMDSTGVEALLARGADPASFVVLRGANGAVAEWAATERPYLRMGTTPSTLTPGQEFDALIYVDSVGPPDYDIP